MSWTRCKSNELITRFEVDFPDIAWNVLEKHQVDFDDVNFWVYDRPGQQCGPTLQITADWAPELEPAWKAVVSEIKGYIDGELVKSGFSPSDVVVEIVDDLLVKAKTVGPVVDNERLEAEWPTIRDNVFSILQSSESTKGAMSSIAIFRFGHSNEDNENPITVFISLDRSAPDSAWPQALGTIQDYLDTLPHELTAHIEHYTVDLCAFDLLPPDGPDFIVPPRPAYQERVNFGSEISPMLYLFDRDGNKRNSGLGTLGCYVEVRTKKSSGWTRYALTNYHVVRPCFDGFRLSSDNQKDGESAYDEEVAPTEGSCCWKADTNGFSPTRPRRHEVGAPSMRTHDLLVNNILSEMEQRKVQYPHRPDKLQPLKEELESRHAFFDNGRNRLGHLWAGSGLARRTAGNQRLDWALIRVREGRQGSNMLPPSDDWAESIGWIRVPYAFSVPLKQASLRDMKPGEFVYKYGAATGYSCGRCQRYKPLRWTRHDKSTNMGPSSEHMFVFHKKPLVENMGFIPTFESYGDAGSVVFDTWGHVVGLASTGQVPSNSDGSGFVFMTPIEDVLADIKSFSGDNITDIRVSTW